MATVTGGGKEELRRLAAQLRTADPKLRRNLVSAMRKAAGPVVKATQDAILDSPSKHDGTLRREVAKTVSSAISTAGSQVTLNIISSGSRMPEGKENLPAYLNDATRWRHPVFGHEPWVPQSSRAEGWFDQTISGQARDLQAAVQGAMDETARQLED